MPLIRRILKISRKTLKCYYEGAQRSLRKFISVYRRLRESKYLLRRNYHIIGGDTNEEVSWLLGKEKRFVKSDAAYSKRIREPQNNCA